MIIEIAIRWLRSRWIGWLDRTVWCITSSGNGKDCKTVAMVQNQMPPSTITISHGSAWVPTVWCSSKMMMMMTTTIEDDDDNDNDDDNNNNDNNNDKDDDNYNYNDTDNDTDNDNNDNNNDHHDDDDNDTDNDNNNNNDDNSSNDNNDDNDDSDRVFFILRPQRMTAARSREKTSAFSSVHLPRGQTQARARPLP